MTTALQPTTWQLGDLPLNARDDTGVEWIITAEAGWWSAPPRRIHHTEVPYADGALRTRSYARPRVITFEGAVIAPTRPELDRQLSRLAALCTLGGLETLTDGTYTTEVEVSDSPDIVRLNSTSAKFQLTVIAPDPKKYAGPQMFSTPLAAATGGLDWATGGGLDWATGGGLDWGLVTSIGQLTIENPGTAETWPVFTISSGSGTVTNPRIRAISLGREITYGGVLGSSSTVTLTVDPLNRTVLANGTVDQRALLTSAQWFAIPPGESVTIAYSADAATGGSTTDSLLTATLRPAYW